MFYRKIIGVRSDLGMTQEEMANYLNISVRSYRNKEKGTRPSTQVELILILQKAKLSYEDAGKIFLCPESNKELYENFINKYIV